MKLSMDCLPNYFTIGTIKNSHYTVPTNCHNFINRGSRSLLVTIGESWTYGSELENRLDDVYGNQISKYFDWDWLNLSQPGASNFHMAEWATEFSNIAASLEYNNIVIVCVFTEIGRGFNSHHDIHLDYNSWISSNVCTHVDFYNFIEMLNQDCCSRIVNSCKPFSKIFFSTNFVSPLGLDTKYTLPSTWFDVLNINLPVKTYAGTTGVQRLESLQKFLHPEQLTMFKIWFAEMITNALYADKICANIGRPNLTHPAPYGHKVWADFVIKHIHP